MNVIILEDQLSWQMRMKEAIQKTIDLGIGDIFISSRPKEIIEQAEKQSSGNVYFLDLEIEGQQRAGFLTANEIRKRDSFGAIIFVTTHSEMAPVTFEYQVSALDFIAKDLLPEAFSKKVRSCLQKAALQNEKLSNDYDYFVFKNKYSNFQIPFKEILYFETSEIPHKLNLVSIHKTMEFYADLKEVEGIDERLFRCHRSYVVNLEHIRTIHKKEKEIELDCGKSCLLSRRYMKLLLDKISG